jgi:hypothetical protein
LLGYIKQPTMEIKLQKTTELITPERARAIIETLNTNNRKVDKARVKEYAMSMEKGEWQYNPLAPLSFGVDGMLSNGQHRLIAQLVTNTEQLYDVVYNTSEELIKVIDTGKSRSAIDQVNIQHSDLPNQGTVVAIATFVLKYKPMIMGLTDKPIGKISRNDIVDYVSQNKLMLGEVSTMARRYRRSFVQTVSAKVLGGMYIILAEIDPDMALLFIDELVYGKYNASNYPPAVLKVFLYNDFFKPPHLRKINNELDKISAFLQAWNAFRKRKQISTIKCKGKKVLTAK